MFQSKIERLWSLMVLHKIFKQFYFSRVFLICNDIMKKAGTLKKPIRKVSTKPANSSSKPNKGKRKTKFTKSSSESHSAPPISASLSSFLKKWPILTPDFFQIDALDLAPRLLGKFLRRDDVVLQITEVEAYRQNDSACHGRFGVTARTAPVIQSSWSVWQSERMTRFQNLNEKIDLFCRLVKH
ncbi:unnamed protein product [Cuscuta epithymum]|uniref:DNA-3-methyladenine glycosylase II n=1 Tax=Cuscuta epithymum TaxID=186058 RepID=A0AAV0EK28_9ASTE|nr:unnamed protein product [Cuscuta epithymum]